MEPVYSKFWLPFADVAKHGAEVDRLILVTHIFMAVLFVGWGIFFLYCLWTFRASRGVKARYHDVGGSVSKAIEAVVVVIEVVLLVVFSMPVWQRVKNEFPKDEDAEHVRVIAQQFQWYFHHPGTDRKFGKTKISLIDDVDNPIGLDRTSEGGKDDFVKPQLTCPVDTPLILTLTSKDVIHSFKIPVMRFTHDVNPGIQQRVYFEPIKTGKYDIACAQLCGIGHTNMRSDIVIVSKDEFRQFVEKNSRK